MEIDLLADPRVPRRPILEAEPSTSLGRPRAGAPRAGTGRLPRGGNGRPRSSRCRFGGCGTPNRRPTSTVGTTCRRKRRGALPGRLPGEQRRGGSGRLQRSCPARSACASSAAGLDGGGRGGRRRPLPPPALAGARLPEPAVLRWWPPWDRPARPRRPRPPAGARCSAPRRTKRGYGCAGSPRVASRISSGTATATLWEHSNLPDDASGLPQLEELEEPEAERPLRPRRRLVERDAGGAELRGHAAQRGRHASLRERLAAGPGPARARARGRAASVRRQHGRESAFRDEVGRLRRRRQPPRGRRRRLLGAARRGGPRGNAAARRALAQEAEAKYGEGV